MSNEAQQTSTESRAASAGEPSDCMLDAESRLWNIETLRALAAAPSLDIHVARAALCWFRKDSEQWVFNVETIIKTEFCKFQSQNSFRGCARWRHACGFGNRCGCVGAAEPIALTFSIENRPRPIGCGGNSSWRLRNICARISWRRFDCSQTSAGCKLVAGDCDLQDSWAIERWLNRAWSPVVCHSFVGCSATICLFSPIVDLSSKPIENVNTQELSNKNCVLFADTLLRNASRF